jgi:hypothetical protein
VTAHSDRRLAYRAVAILAAAALGLTACGGTATKHRRAAAPRPTRTAVAVARPHRAHHRRHHQAICPLTGLPAPGGRVPQRRALAIKVENTPEARPQAGLDHADIIYEEPVEGGITRFIVIFQCHQANRVEPVRSGRLVDPLILVQYRHPLMGYAGAIGPVIFNIDHSGIIDVNYDIAVNAYWRDPNRVAPHNLVTSTSALWAFGRRGPPPFPVFQYTLGVPPGSKPAPTIHIPFSGWSNVTWRYHDGYYLRYYNGTEPALLMDGAQISARNIVVMMVRLTPSPYVEDITGTHEWDVHVIGRGPAAVYRNGRVIRGIWVRRSLHSLTEFVDLHNHVIKLRPGVTWVELVPMWVPVTPF